MSDQSLTVEEIIEYCRLQARLLAGTAETLTREANDLLDQIDEDVAAIESSIDELQDDPPSTTAPATVTTPAAETDIESLEEEEQSLEERQAQVAAKQTRISLFQDLANEYAALTESLRDETITPEAALEQVIQFEAEKDVPAYFDDRQTLLEAARTARDTDDDS